MTSNFLSSKSSLHCTSNKCAHTHTHTHIYIYIYMCVCMCVCVRMHVCVSEISIKSTYLMKIPLTVVLNEG